MQIILKKCRNNYSANYYINPKSLARDYDCWINEKCTFTSWSFLNVCMDVSNEKGGLI